MRFNADARSPERIREHYEIEKALARKLRQAPKAERAHLYTALYDEMFRRVPDHPMLEPPSPGYVEREVERQLALLRRFLRPETVFLEVGPGACALSFAVARQVRQVYGVEVSEELPTREQVPANFTLLHTDGSSIDLPDATVDLAYSNQLMEHLHPDDAVDQLGHIHRVLTARGLYVCTTPNRLSGPWDVSRAFDRVASGFHLHEYTVNELCGLLRGAGFRRIHAYVGARGIYRRFPLAVIRGLERLLETMPAEIGWRAAHTAPAQVLLGMRLVAAK